MRIGIYRWMRQPHSIAAYTEAIVGEFEKHGVDIAMFGESDTVPNSVDLYWDPGTGRPGPHRRLRRVAAPLVVTFHGAAPLSLSARDCYGQGVVASLKAAMARRTTRRQWRSFSGRRLITVAVSHYAKREAVARLGLVPDDVVPIYHGVDGSRFSPAPGPPDGEKRYFLHVSQFQPKKNVDTVIEAYRRLSAADRPKLILVCPGYATGMPPAGVRLVTKSLPAAELARLYRGATAFIFPSLHETFGMPILEAMACGCPVITSNVTACPEIAGDAAILVDPRSVAEISEAMGRVADDARLRAALRERGLCRAREFTWQRCAEQHLTLFERARFGAEPA